MKRWIVLFLALLAFAPQLRADQTTKRVKIHEVFVAIHIDRSMSQLMDLMMVQTNKTIQDTPGIDQLTPQQKGIFDNYMSQVKTLITDTLGWKAIEPAYVELYANAFTEEEVDGMLAFYKSPLGQAVLNKTPQLMQQGAQITQERMADVQPQLKALEQDFMKKLEATVPVEKAQPAAAGKSTKH